MFHVDNSLESDENWYNNTEVRAYEYSIYQYSIYENSLECTFYLTALLSNEIHTEITLDYVARCRTPKLKSAVPHLSHSSISASTT
jgi:hypothetical protein